MFKTFTIILIVLMVIYIIRPKNEGMSDYIKPGSSMVSNKELAKQAARGN